MTRTRHIGRTLMWGLACGWPLGASAAPLPELACAAGVHCTGTGSAIGARARLGMDRNQAELAFVEASRDWPDTVWSCAATASQCGHLSRDEARILIGLHDDAYGPAQRLRGAPPAAQSAAMQAPLVVAATNPSASGRGPRDRMLGLGGGGRGRKALAHGQRLRRRGRGRLRRGRLDRRGVGRGLRRTGGTPCEPGGQGQARAHDEGKHREQPHPTPSGLTDGGPQGRQRCA